MTSSCRSLQVFACYMITGGIGFMIAPHPILALFSLSAGDDFWVRMVGVLVLAIGCYYLLVVRAGIVAFYRWTVPARYFVAGFMVLMFVLGKVGAPILLFAAIDAAAATWTWFELKSRRST